MEKCFHHRDGAERFTFFGRPAHGQRPPAHRPHRDARHRDLIPRFQTMKGKDVGCKAGWDTHGLPVELEVEKQLGLDGKPQIEAYGIEPFIKKCKESVWKYQHEWEEMSDRVGYWADMEHPYITLLDDYIRVRSGGAMKKIWKRVCCIWATRSRPTAPAAAPRSPATRSRRATRRSATFRPRFASRS